jgi:DNA-binding CsgD family transcriptional regulator
MALSGAGGEELPIRVLYAEVTRDWVRQVHAYTHSMLLYRQAALRRRATKASDLRRDARVAPATVTTYETVTEVRTQRVQVSSTNHVGDVALTDVGATDAARAGQHAKHRLTLRQLEIAGLIAEGLTNAQIADRLVVSRGTVGNHIGHMLRRLGVHNRAQIAAWMIRHSADAG